VGIWKPIFIEAYDTAVIRDILFEATPHSASDDELAQRLRTAAAYHTSDEQGSVPYYEAADAYKGKKDSEMQADELNAADIARAYQRYVLRISEVCPAYIRGTSYVYQMYVLRISDVCPTYVLLVSLGTEPVAYTALSSHQPPWHFSFLSRKDRGYDLTTWDAVVNIFLDAGINDLPVTHIYGDDGEGPNKPSNSAAAITGSLLVEITPVTAGGGNNAGAEHAEAATPIASKTVKVTLTPGE
jgi:hypothetical protein